MLIALLKILNRGFVQKFILYGIIGGISASFDYGVFFLLNSLLNVNEFVGNSISIHCGIFLSFILNRKYNFKKEDKVLKRFLQFYSTGLFGLILSNLIIAFGLKLEISIYAVKLFSIFIVAIVQFTINAYITFRK